MKLLSALLLLGNAYAVTLDVGSGQTYATIQAAVAASNCGDTILVHSGFTGAGFSITAANHASCTSSTVLTVTTQDNTITLNSQGNTSGDVINIDTVNYVTVHGFNVTCASRYGIRAVVTTGTTIDGNTITGCLGIGLLVGFYDLLTLTNNISHNNGSNAGTHGFYVSNADKPLQRAYIAYNEAYSNGGAGLQLNGDCQTLDPSGVSTGVLNGVVVEGNYFHGNGAYDLSMINASNTIVRNNILALSTGGIGEIKLADQGCNLPTDNNVFINNTILSTSIGVRVVSGSNNLFFGNLLLVTLFAGTAGGCIWDPSSTPCDGTSTTNGNTMSLGSSLGPGYGTGGSNMAVTSSITSSVFNNYSGGDYTLKTGSIAIGACPAAVAGFAAPKRDKAKNGRPSGTGTGYDCGGYEFGTSSVGPDTTPPTTPGTPTVTLTPTSGSLAWTASTDAQEVVGYYLTRNSVPYAAAFQAAFSDSSISPGGSYSYTIVAFDAAWNFSTASSAGSGTAPGIVNCLNGDAATYNLTVNNVTTSYIQRAVLVRLQTGLFELAMDATPFNRSSDNKQDGTIGVSFAPPSSYPDMAVIIRFNGNETDGSGFTNNIDVRNGGSYNATTNLTFSSGVAYHIRADIDVANHVYSVWVTPAGGSETQIASNYAFRTGQGSVVSLAYLSDYDDIGYVAVCSPTINGLGALPGGYTTVSTQSLYTQAVTTKSIDVNGSGKPVFDLPDGTALTGDRTLTASDNALFPSATGSSAHTVTVPSGLPLGFSYTILQEGTGQVTFCGTQAGCAGGIQLHSLGNATHTTGQSAVGVIQCSKVTANYCVLKGDVQ